MHSTKTEILALLKRADGASVDDLATSLGLAAMTVRQHLTALERDDLVSAVGVRRATGRPHYHYRLTDNGHRRVSEGYDRLVALLVEQAGWLEPADVAGASPEERRRMLFERAAAALAERHRHEVQALSGRDQVERVVQVLRSHGGFAEWHEIDAGFEIRDFACVYRTSAGAGGPCAWHETFLSQLLTGDVRAATGATDCADCCRYIVAARVPVPANRGY
ncbi:MAG: winged helix-turn-helix transcriptional regulator [Dehalococcoidia bacterium]